MKKAMLKVLKNAMVILVCYQSVALADDLDKIEQNINHSFTNSIIRAFDQALDSPNHYLMNILVWDLSGLKDQINRYLSAHPSVSTNPNFQLREILFFRDILAVAKDSIDASDVYYDQVSASDDPANVREWSYQNMIGAKIHMVDILTDYLDWIQDSDNTRDIYAEKNFQIKIFHIALSIKQLMNQRYPLSFAEYSEYHEQVLKPVSDLTVGFMKWLEMKKPEYLPYFNNLIFDVLDEDTTLYYPLLKKLSRGASQRLWSLRNAHSSLSGFRFVVDTTTSIENQVSNNFLNDFLQSENRGSIGNTLNSAELLDEVLVDTELSQYGLTLGSYFPEELTDYILTDAGTLSPAEFLYHIDATARSWKDFAKVLSDAGITVESRRKFDQFLYQKLSSIDVWKNKGVTDLVRLTQDLFSNYIPQNANIEGPAFQPTRSNASYAHSKPSAILNSVTHELTQSHPYVLRKFFERFVFDFTLLVDQVVPLKPSDISELNKIFHFYGRLQIRSKVIEDLALMVLNSELAKPEDRILAGEFLLYLDDQLYAFVEDQLSVIKPEPMKIAQSAYSQDVSLLKVSQDPKQDLGVVVYSVSPYALSPNSQSCEIFLK